MMDRVYFELADGTILQPYEDWGMLLKHFDAPPPEPRLYTVEIEGMDGTLDMTEWTGNVQYQSREVVVSLRDMRGHFQRLVNLLNGRQAKIWRMSEPDFFYVGRCSGIPYEALKHHVTDGDFTFLCDPYRRTNKAISGTAPTAGKDFTLQVETKPAIPTITFAAECEYDFGGTRYTHAAGEFVNPAIVMTKTPQTMTVYPEYGDTDVTIKWQEVCL